MSTKKHTFISIRQERQQFLEYQLAMQEDCEHLLSKYEKLNTFQFHAFASLWVDLKFSLIYTGRYRSQELGHFIEMAFNCVKKYIIFTKSLHIQIGAFYILYGLYYKQPYQHMVKIRIVMEEFKVLQEVMKVMREIQQKDPLYIFSKMLTDEAFQFTVTQYSLGLELKYLPVDLKLSDNIFPVIRTEMKDDFKEIRDGILKELYKTEDEYQERLKKYLGKTKERMEVFPLNLRSDIDLILDGPSAMTDIELSDKRRRIKAKSFAKLSKFERKFAGQKHNTDDSDSG